MTKKIPKTIKNLVSLAVVLAFLVVILGAYTRLTDAGLGCPDWPGCYGHLTVPQQKNLLPNDSNFLQTTLEPRKAWTEMIHRYAAGTLAILIFTIGGYTFVQRKKEKQFPLFLPLFLMLLVLFQAALGMWTVTLKLLPAVVMAHLLGGITLFACLCQLRLRLSSTPAINCKKSVFYASLLGCILLFIQIGLGGWVSANYAGIACIGFPQCNGHWWTPTPFSQGFNLFTRIGENYQGGLLENQARAAIQMVHRLGALISFSYIALLMLFIASHFRGVLRTLSAIVILVLLLQISLGAINVLYLLPLWSAVAHNGVAALLFACLLMLLYLVQGDWHDHKN